MRNSGMQPAMMTSLDVVLAQAMDLQILLAFCTNLIPLILNVDSPY